MASASTITVKKESDAKVKNDKNIKVEDSEDINHKDRNKNVNSKNIKVETKSERNDDIRDPNGEQELNHQAKLPNAKLLFRFSHTKMAIDLDRVNQNTSNNPNFNKLFNEETMYHYCNLLLEKYNPSDVTLALFRTSNDYGPPKLKENIDIFFHPFKWDDDWHLAIAFTQYEKMLIVNCSDLPSNETTLNQNTSFPIQTSLRLRNFIKFFGHKISKYSLKYPRIFADLYEPSTKFNSINLLIVIFSFCVDPVSLTRSFCDPQFSPRKFDITDMYPIVGRLDVIFRKEYSEELKNIRKKRDAVLHDLKLKEEKQKAEVVKLQSRTQVFQPAKNIKQKDNNSSKLKQQAESQSKGKSFTEKTNELKKRNAALTNETTDSGHIAKRLKHSLRPNGSINAPIEINELDEESSESAEEDEADNENKNNEKEEKEERNEKKVEVKKGGDNNDISDNKVTANNNVIKPNKPTIEDAEIENLKLQEEILKKEQIIKQQQIELSRKEHIIKLEAIFQQKFGLEFKKHVKNLTLFADNNKLNLMYEFIKNVSYNPLTNPNLFEVESNKLVKQPFEIRDCLLVNYKRRMKQEFDEEKFSKMLKTDYKNQIIPLIFENGSIFLINIKTNDDFNCIVKLVCISNRTNRSEREIMRNYAFRRLIEMYVAKFNRLVIKIRCSINHVDTTSFYKIATQSIYSLHHILWKNKFDLSFKVRMDSLENYITFFEKIMKATEENDMFKTELNFKRLVKHVLTPVSSSDEWHPQLVA